MQDIVPGSVFSRLTVVRKITKQYDGANRTFYLCNCSCGVETEVHPTNLTKGNTKSCGCLNFEGRDFTPYVGQTFNRLTIEKLTGIKEYCGTRHAHALCKCFCGNTVETLVGLVVSGRKKSCGCFGKMYKERLAKCIQTLQRVAIREGRVWELTAEKTENLILGNCYYCDLPAEEGTTHKGITRNGIDRVDSSLGYIDSNVVSCCRDCNRAKLALTPDQFKALVTRIYHHYVKGN